MTITSRAGLSSIAETRYISALFLSGLNVMDYSLVVGVDVERKELVVGVVDYIRTFTWQVIATF